MRRTISFRVAKGLGIEFDLLDPAEVARRDPLINWDGLPGALWDDPDSYIDLAPLCQALARRARQAGAEINRNCPVTALTQKQNNEWMCISTKATSPPNVW